MDPDDPNHRYTSRRTALKGMGIALAAGTTGLAGCIGGDDGGVEPLADELTVWHAMGGALGETLDEIAADFQDETGIEVTMQFQDSYEDVLQNTISGFDSGEMADMLQVDSLFAQQVLDTGDIEPVENILPDDFDTDEFLDNVTDFFVIDGELSSMPFNNSNAIMYINRDAFEAAGLDPDDPPSTLAEVRTASEAIVGEGITDFGITWPNHVWFVEHWYSFEGELMTDAQNGHDGDPSEFRTPAPITDLYEWWQGMEADGLYTNPGIEAWGEATSLFVEEDCAMLLTSTASVSGLIADSEFAVDAAPYPTISETRVGPVIGGASFYVPAGFSDDRYDEIGQLLEFMADPAVQVDWHKGTGYYPITQSSLDELRSENWFTENPMYETALNQLRDGDTSDPATKRILLGPARQVQTTVQDGSVDIIGSSDVEGGIADMGEQATGELQDYYE